MPELTDHGLCDFCSDPSPVRKFGADDFLLDVARPAIGLPALQSVGAWLACAACARAIDARDWSQLEDRAVTVFMAKYGLDRDFARQFVRQAQAGFRQHFERTSAT
jgi:hypothetical protein